MTKPDGIGSDWRVVSYLGVLPFKQVRIYDGSLVRGILEHIRSSECITLLGPPFSEKTELLHDVASALESTGYSLPLYLDLWQVRSDDETAFFTSLASLMINALGRRSSVSASQVTDPLSFTRFLTICMDLVDRQLVLLIDHLQAIPYSLIHGLLVALRAAYTEQHLDAPHRLVAVVVGGTRLMGMSASPTSPFNIAKPVVVRELSHEQTLALTEAAMERLGIPASSKAIAMIADWAEGDRYLVPQLCVKAAAAVAGHKTLRITTATVQRVAERLLLMDDATPPLRAAIQTIEEDPDTVLDIIQILEQGTLSQSRSRRMLTRTGTDRLQLSGAVAIVDETYRIKNRAFQQALARHFTPERVTHVLRTAGRWRAALDFLTAQLSTDGSSAIRPLLFETIIQSINVTDSLQEAFSNLTRGLERGSGLDEIGIYKASHILGKLKLVDSERGESPPTLPPSIDLEDSTQVEVQTFHYGAYALRGTTDEARLLVSLIGRQRPIGLVTIRLHGPHLERGKIPSGLADILSFLQQCADAIANVMARSAYRIIVQATLSGDLAHVLEVVCETLGSNWLRVYLLNQSRTSLDVAFSLSSNRNIKHGSPIPLDQLSNHPAVECLREQHMLVVRGSDQRLISDDDKSDLRSHTFLFYPLHTKDRQIGVLELGFYGGIRTGSGSPVMQDLVMFADQIAIAILSSQFLPSGDGSTGIPKLKPAAIRRHLEQQLAELNNNYAILTEHIVAADKDINRAATNLEKQIALERKRDLEIEREQFVIKMIKIEEELAQS